MVAFMSAFAGSILEFWISLSRCIFLTAVRAYTLSIYIL